MPKIPMKTIQHAWSLLAAGVSVDQDTNNLTLFNVIDQVAIPRNQLVEMPTLDGDKKPAAPIGFILVSQWRKLKDNIATDADAIIELLDPDGVVRQKVDYKVNFSEKIERLRSRIQWNGVRVTTSGVYTFRISLREKGKKEFSPVGETYLKIEILEPAEAPTKTKRE
jgi:hypothetical protein